LIGVTTFEFREKLYGS